MANPLISIDEFDAFTCATILNNYWNNGYFVVSPFPGTNDIVGIASENNAEFYSIIMIDLHQLNGIYTFKWLSSFNIPYDDDVYEELTHMCNSFNSAEPLFKCFIVTNEALNGSEHYEHIVSPSDPLDTLNLSITWSIYERDGINLLNFVKNFSLFMDSLKTHILMIHKFIEDTFDESELQ